MRLWKLLLVGCSAAAVAQTDPRVGLKPGRYDAGVAASNMKLLSTTKAAAKFEDGVNSDLAFFGPYAIQGSFNGFQIWNISDPTHPTLRTSYYCPASQSDVSVYKNLLIVSAEAPTARLDCGDKPIEDTVSTERIRGIRIFDISDLDHPKYITNVQTCRGSHTHSLLVDPKDPENVYVYISGSSLPRSPQELPGCTVPAAGIDPASALLRVEIIKIPMAHPEKAAVVSSARIFDDLKAPPAHGETAADSAEFAAAAARGDYIVSIIGMKMIAPKEMVGALLQGMVKQRGGTGAPTAADSATLRSHIQEIMDHEFGAEGPEHDRSRFAQCHDITMNPSIGLAGGACEGHGLLLDIKDPLHPKRLDVVDDKNFSYWHSATFSNDGKKVIFTDEWGGGEGPKCRATDPHDWGADAIFTIENDQKLRFQSYYKLPAVQTPQENCVAHNGSIVPVPGRDIMVQSWYQGGVSVFDFTDAMHPKEIAFFDRGPLDANQMILGGSWSAYWYNGVIASSEITRGLDLFDLTPSDMLSQNEIDAAKTVKLEYLNVQDQPRYSWPPSFSLARAYADQLERSAGVSADRLAAVRQTLSAAESASGAARRTSLTQLATQLDADAAKSSDAAKVRLLADAVRGLAK
jgi:hypothetical protein